MAGWWNRAQDAAFGLVADEDDQGIDEAERRRREMEAQRARMAALSAFGSQMLAASGYSRVPITGGQALGAGLDAGRQAGAKTRELQAKDRDARRKQQELEWLRKADLENLPTGELLYQLASRPALNNVITPIANARMTATQGPKLASKLAQDLHATYPDVQVGSKEWQQLYRDAMTQTQRGARPTSIDLLNEKMRLWQEAKGDPEKMAALEFAAGKGKGTTRRIYGPDGQLIIEEGGAGELRPPTENAIEAKIVAAQDRLANLKNLAATSADEYLNYAGRIGRFSLRQKSNTVGLSGEEQKWMDGAGKFLVRLNDTFNRYVNEITGAAIGVQEIDRLRAAMVNGDMSPAEFKADVVALIEIAEEEIERKRQQLGRSGPRVQGKSADDYYREAGNGP